MAMQLSGSINLVGSLTGSILANNGLVSSSQQVTNYYKFAETASANTTFYGNVIGQGNVQANKFVFTDGVVASNAGGQNIIGTNANILYLYAGTSGFYLNNQGNSVTLLSVNNSTGYTNIIGGLQIGSAGNDQSFTFGGTNSSIYWGSGGPARMYYNVGDIKISSNGAADVLTVKNIGGILVNGGITGSLMATNGVVSGSQQIIDYNTFAVTSSANTFYGLQTISGSLRVSSSLRTNIITGGLDVNGGITGSFKGNLAGVADYASTIVVVNTGTTTDTTLYPTFTLQPILAQYTSLYSHASSSFFYNGVTRRLHMEGFVVSGSNNIAEISGSLIVTGSSTITGSFLVSGSTTQIGNNTLTGNTVLSGSLAVSASSTFTGNVNVNGDLYKAGNKLFNHGQWASLETQTGSADTAYSIKLGTPTNGPQGVSVANNGSGFPTRLTVENTGIYNIQFSLQLHTTSNESVDFSVWLAMTGSNVANSNTDFSIEKVSGGGFQVAALNYLTPITANDYVELYWSKTTANGQLQYKAAQSTPTRPATPSAIVTITQVA